MLNFLLEALESVVNYNKNKFDSLSSPMIGVIVVLLRRMIF